ncbi:MAG: RNA polymerase sigma factor [Planctomycetota bacterium]
MQPDEKELLTQVFAGAPGAFETLLERYRGLVFAVFSAPGFDFPRDYLDDIFQSFVIALSRNDYKKLRSFEGRNSATLATFLQVVATRFALDERRRWRRQPRGRGEAGRDDDEFTWEIEDEEGATPDQPSLDQEQTDIFHNLLFSLDWKRVSTVLWVFRDIPRERIADVMSTSRANIDALYKRAKDQMARFYSEGSYRRRGREADPEVLVPPVVDLLQSLLRHTGRDLTEALLQPGAKRRALVGLVLLDYPRYLCSTSELARMGKIRKAEVPALAQEVLQELLARVETRAGGERAEP